MITDNTVQQNVKKVHSLVKIFERVIPRHKIRRLLFESSRSIAI